MDKLTKSLKNILIKHIENVRKIQIKKYIGKLKRVILVLIMKKDIKITNDIVLIEIKYRDLLLVYLVMFLYWPVSQ